MDPLWFWRRKATPPPLPMDPVRRKQLEDMMDAASARAQKKRKEIEDAEQKAKQDAMDVARAGEPPLERQYDHALRMYMNAHPDMEPWIAAIRCHMPEEIPPTLAEEK